jgi:hypothetical protein
LLRCAHAPAFRAGIAAWIGSIASRNNVARMLDTLADPAMLFDVGGALVHANPASSASWLRSTHRDSE